MGLDDRDYMRKRPLRWDERSGEMRLDEEEQPRGWWPGRARLHWRVVFAIAVAVIGFAGAGYWISRTQVPVVRFVGGPPGHDPVEQVPATPERRGPEADLPATIVPSMAQPIPAAEGDCKIKGNISRNGKIYHVPGSASYNATKIDESKGEQWFCTEAEAQAAGWRPPKN